MGVERRRPRRPRVGLEDGDRCQGLVARDGVDQHQQVVAVEQVEREVHAADAVVLHPDVERAVGGLTSRCATSTPKPSSRLKMLPIPATRRAHSGSTSSGWKYRNRPCALLQLGAGVVVERDRDVLVPSTSKNTPSTVASMPSRKRSCASVRRPAPRRAGGAPSTPSTTATPAIWIDVLPRVHRGVDRRLPPRQHVWLRRADCPDGAHLAVQAGEHLRREPLDPVDDRGGPRVGAAGQPLLVVGEREDPQGEDLVDLGGVAHVARALGRDGGVVVQDDRRRQDGGGLARGRR